MTDYSPEAIARRLKRLSEARRLGLSLRRAGNAARSAPSARVAEVRHERGEASPQGGKRKRDR